MFKTLKRPTIKALSLALIFTMMICTIIINPIHADNAVITTDRIADKNEAGLNETITLNYSIQPQPIAYEKPAQKEKEIVLVIDTSGSMRWDIEGNETYNVLNQRMTIAKDTALKFIENIENNNKVKISLVSYENIAYVKEVLTTNFGDVKSKISSLKANGGTNIGDGLRRAYYELNKGNSEAEKYIILLTDGEPTYHSYEYVRKKRVFFMGSGVPHDYRGGGSIATENDIDYCYKVVNDLIKTKNIMTYMVAFTEGSNKNILQELANAAGGEYKAAADSDALQKVYQNISNELVSDFAVSNVIFEEVFPDGIEIVPFSEGSDFTIEGQKVSATLDSICYKYNQATSQYEAAPISFEVKVKGTVAGDYILGENNSSKLTYKGVNGEECCEYFPEVQVSVLGPIPTPTPMPTPTPTPMPTPTPTPTPTPMPTPTPTPTPTPMPTPIPYGEPNLQIKGNERVGEKVKVTLGITLPDNTKVGILKRINNETNEEIEIISNITVSGDYDVSGLSIYEDHKVILYVESNNNELKDTGEIVIFRALDAN